MVRTRFAPSPTGSLHLGNVRTGLFAWAYARRHGGKFILRIEDTDLERSTEEAKLGILRDMAWLGLDYDEGPFYQMQRMARYKEVIRQWLAEGKAYHCYMSPDELDALRAGQMARGEKPRYDARWRPENIHKNGLIPPVDVKPVVRFKNPLDGSVGWDDAVKGRIEISNHELDDLIIARPDGTPTYNFCVVIDDFDMQITHVIRGDDHVNNTPRQINMFHALGAPLPVFAHTPTVLGQDGEKLSKRHGATSLEEYAEEGYLPGAMLNFLARLGWSHGDTEVFTKQELAQWFTLEGISPSPGRFNPDKLAWLNQEHIKRAEKNVLGEMLKPFVVTLGCDVSRGAPLADVADLYRERAVTLREMAESVLYFYRNIAPPAELLAQHITDANRPALQVLAQRLASVEWNKDGIHAAIKPLVAEFGLKMPQIMMPLRVALTGLTQTPAIDAVMTVLGREVSLRRLAHACAQR
jgi:glutamyl-tRNA synthetase